MRVTAARPCSTCPQRTTFQICIPRKGTWYKFFSAKFSTKFPAKAQANNGAMWGRFRDLPVPRMRSRVDQVVPRTPGDDPAQPCMPAPPASTSSAAAEGDKAVLDSRDGSVAVLPGPAPRKDKFPSNKTYYEIPIAIQDRSFNADGSLFYPDSRVLRRHRPRLHPARGVLPDLESGILRQHDHGQRQHLAIPNGRAAALPIPVPERLPVSP